MPYLKKVNQGILQKNKNKNDKGGDKGGKSSKNKEDDEEEDEDEDTARARKYEQGADSEDEYE